MDQWKVKFFKNINFIHNVEYINFVFFKDKFSKKMKEFLKNFQKNLKFLFRGKFSLKYAKNFLEEYYLKENIFDATFMSHYKLMSVTLSSQNEPIAEWNVKLQEMYLSAATHAKNACTQPYRCYSNTRSSCTNRLYHLLISKGLQPEVQLEVLPS